MNRICNVLIKYNSRFAYRMHEAQRDFEAKQGDTGICDLIGIKTGPEWLVS